MNNWKTKRLGDFFTFQRGHDLLAKDRNEGNIPVISSSGVTGYHDRFKAKAPGVIIGRKGTLGTVHYSSMDYWPHDTTLWITNFKNNSPKFIYYFLQLLHLEKYDTGSSNPTLNRNHIHEIIITLPALTEQNKIAAVLSALDSKIELNNRINAELESLAKTIYDYWFVQFDFPDDRGKPYKSSGGKMVYNKEIDRAIPADWEVGTLSQLGDIGGGSTPSTKNPLNFCQDGIAWITPKDLSLNTGNKFISKGELDVTLLGVKDASLRIYPKGTILLSSRAPIGYMAIARNEVTTNQGFKSFIPNQRFSVSFVYYAVKNSMNAIVKYASGSTFKEISLASLKDRIYVSLPTSGILNLYTKKVTSIFEKQDILERENQQLIQLRDWLLPMLMNGQVSVK